MHFVVSGILVLPCRKCLGLPFSNFFKTAPLNARTCTTCWPASCLWTRGPIHKDAVLLMCLWRKVWLSLKSHAHKVSQAVDVFIAEITICWQNRRELGQGFASAMRHAFSMGFPIGSHWCTYLGACSMSGQRLVPSKDGGTTATLASWRVLKPLMLMIINTLVASLHQSKLALRTRHIPPSRLCWVENGMPFCCYSHVASCGYIPNMCC